MFLLSRYCNTILYYVDVHQKFGKHGATVPQCDKTALNEKIPLLVRTSICTLWIELFQFLLLLSFGIALGFQKRYITTSYLKGPRNGSWSNLEVEKNL